MLIDGLLVNVGTSSAIFFPSGNVLGVIAGFFGCNKNYLKNGIREEDRKFLNQVELGSGYVISLGYPRIPRISELEYL